MRILLVEDSERVVTVVTAALESSAHTVTASGSCSAALAELALGTFDLAIVDIGLPDGSGLDVCRAVRGQGHDLPILLLTARNEVEHRVRGLDAGADDYLGKPFATAELTARVRALGRRGPRWTDSARAFGEVTIDRDRRLATRGGVPVALTPREFEIVALLAWADGRVLERGAILDMVWGDTGERASASLEVLIARVRRKLAGPESAVVIRTVRQVGYAWALARSKRP